VTRNGGMLRQNLVQGRTAACFRIYLANRLTEKKACQLWRSSFSLPVLPHYHRPSVILSSSLYLCHSIISSLVDIDDISVSLFMTSAVWTLPLPRPPMQTTFKLHPNRLQLNTSMALGYAKIPSSNLLHALEGSPQTPLPLTGG
jgi:hypothetical protein